MYFRLCDVIGYIIYHYFSRFGTGFIKQKYGVSVGQNRIGKALARIALHYHQRRKSNIARMTNPTPYRANYFGHRLHLDQNEKLEMYGV